MATKQERFGLPRVLRNQLDETISSSTENKSLKVKSMESFISNIVINLINCSILLNNSIMNNNNLKSSWRIMKDIISKDKSTSPCSRFYVNDSANITYNKKEIDNFHSFFINVGPNLGRKFHPLPNRRQALWPGIVTVW